MTSSGSVTNSVANVIRQLHATEIVLILLFFVCLGYNLEFSRSGWDNPVADHNGFRQAQTAITTYYLLRGGPWIQYETPVMGIPWSIPLELPVYQWVVAGAVAVFHTPLEGTGRFVNLAFFYLSLVVIYFLLRHIGISRWTHRLVFLSLLLMSPIYLFWSRTFMIESTSVFFGLAFLLAIARYIESRRAGSIIAAVLLGMIASLVKITTFFGFFVAAGFLFLVPLAQTFRGQRWRDAWRAAAVHYVLPAAISLGIPTIVGIAWSSWADHIRILNPMAADSLSLASMRFHNYGLLSWRFSPTEWRPFGDRVLHLAGSVSPLLVVLPLMALLRRRAVLFVSGILLFLTGPIVFMNLHILHDYYSYENGLFLLFSLGVFIVGAVEKNSRIWNAAGIAALCLILFSMHRVYWNNELARWQREDLRNLPAVLAAQTVRSLTKPDDIILVYGMEWSSVIPYYAERRALMDESDLAIHDPRMAAALANLKDRSIGAVVICARSRELQEKNLERLQTLRFDTTARFQNSFCDIYTPRSDLASYPNGEPNSLNR